RLLDDDENPNCQKLTLTISDSLIQDITSRNRYLWKQNKQTIFRNTSNLSGESLDDFRNTFENGDINFLGTCKEANLFSKYHKNSKAPEISRSTCIYGEVLYDKVHVVCTT
ncbi:hypothetical protein L9F63_027008, partial [Diploptera punctata]